MEGASHAALAKPFGRQKRRRSDEPAEPEKPEKKPCLNVDAAASSAKKCSPKGYSDLPRELQEMIWMYAFPRPRGAQALESKRHLFPHIILVNKFLYYDLNSRLMYFTTNTWVITLPCRDVSLLQAFVSWVKRVFGPDGIRRILRLRLHVGQWRLTGFCDGDGIYRIRPMTEDWQAARELVHLLHTEGFEPHQLEFSVNYADNHGGVLLMNAHCGENSHLFIHYVLSPLLKKYNLYDGSNPLPQVIEDLNNSYEYKSVLSRGHYVQYRVDYEAADRDDWPAHILPQVAMELWYIASQYAATNDRETKLELLKEKLDLVMSFPEAGGIEKVIATRIELRKELKDFCRIIGAAILTRTDDETGLDDSLYFLREKLRILKRYSYYAPCDEITNTEFLIRQSEKMAEDETSADGKLGIEDSLGAGNLGETAGWYQSS